MMELNISTRLEKAVEVLVALIVRVFFSCYSFFNVLD